MAQNWYLVLHLMENFNEWTSKLKFFNKPFWLGDNVLMANTLAYFDLAYITIVVRLLAWPSMLKVIKLLGIILS